MKKLIVIVAIILSISAVLAHSGHGDAKQIVDSGIPCSELDDNELEEIGDYFMEQMHPGESHELMDEMMGGEGSESLRQMHIAMARRIYCKENIAVGYGMMRTGMMGGGMMGMMNYGGMMGSGYMSTGSAGWWIWAILASIFWIALFAIAVLLAIWLFRRVTGKENALEILKARYAKGDISKKEFEGMKKEIK